MISLPNKLKVAIFFQKILGKDVKWVCRKLGISRATFYRHKKKLYGEMVITKR
jgi:ACT domain-containing protein